MTSAISSRSRRVAKHIAVEIAGGAARLGVCRLAGETVVAPSDLPYLSFEPGKTAPASKARRSFRGGCFLAGAETLFDGRVLVGHRVRRLRALRGEGYRLEIQGAGQVEIDGTFSHLVVTPDHGVALDELAAVLLGPPLLLALAARGVWALHGSAVATGRGALILLGDTGAGKSTLARELARHAGWKRLTDDLAPVAGGDLRPRYPQLKTLVLASAELPELLPIAGLVAVLPRPPGEPLTTAPLTPRRVVELLTRQTMATRLFDRELTARHLASAASLATSVPALALAYPHRPGAVAEVAEALEGLVA